MSRSIRFSEGTDALLASAAQLDSLNESYVRNYTSFYSLLESDVASNWRGEDAETFRIKSEEMRMMFESLQEIISSYSDALRNAAKANEARMEESRNAVSHLEFD